MQCVANSAPYVGMAVGGLRVMSWRARRSAKLVQHGPRDTRGVTVELHDDADNDNVSSLPDRDVPLAGHNGRRPPVTSG